MELELKCEVDEETLVALRAVYICVESVVDGVPPHSTPTLSHTSLDHHHRQLVLIKFFVMPDVTPLDRIVKRVALRELF